MRRNGTSSTNGRRRRGRHRTVAAALAAVLLASGCTATPIGRDPLVPDGSDEISGPLGADGGTYVLDGLASVTFTADPDRRAAEVDVRPAVPPGEDPAGVVRSLTKAVPFMAELVDADRSFLVEHDGEIGTGVVRVRLTPQEKADPASALLFGTSEQDGSYTVVPARLDREDGIAVAEVPHFSHVIVLKPEKPWVERQLQALWKDLVYADFGDYEPAACKESPAPNVSVAITGDRGLAATHNDRELIPVSAAACVDNEQVAVVVKNNSRIPYTTFFRTPYATPRPSGLLDDDMDPLDWAISLLGAEGVLVPPGVENSLILPPKARGAYLLPQDFDDARTVTTIFNPDFGMAAVYTALVAATVVPGFLELKAGKLAITGGGLTAVQTKTVLKAVIKTYDPGTGTTGKFEEHRERAVLELRREAVYLKLEQREKTALEEELDQMLRLVGAISCVHGIAQNTGLGTHGADSSVEPPDRPAVRKAMTEIAKKCLPLLVAAGQKHAQSKRVKNPLDLLGLVTAPWLQGGWALVSDVLNKAYVAMLTGLPVTPVAFSNPTVTASFNGPRLLAAGDLPSGAEWKEVPDEWLPAAVPDAGPQGNGTGPCTNPVSTSWPRPADSSASGFMTPDGSDVLMSSIAEFRTEADAASAHAALRRFFRECDGIRQALPVGHALFRYEEVPLSQPKLGPDSYTVAFWSERKGTAYSISNATRTGRYILSVTEIVLTETILGNVDATTVELLCR